MLTESKPYTWNTQIKAIVFLLEDSLGKSLQNCLKNTINVYILMAYRGLDNVESMFNFLTETIINYRIFLKQKKVYYCCIAHQRLFTNWILWKKIISSPQKKAITLSFKTCLLKILYSRASDFDSLCWDSEITGAVSI